jgi:hypothetical protein
MVMYIDKLTQSVNFSSVIINNVRYDVTFQCKLMKTIGNRLGLDVFLEPAIWSL